MSKRSGYSVKITAFIEASPTDMEAMQKAMRSIEAVCSVMSGDGFLSVKHDTRFMLSKDIPDTAKPAIPDGGGGGQLTASIYQTSPLDIPTALRRA